MILFYMVLYKFYISALTNPYIGNTKQEVFMQIICLGDSITDCNHLFEDFPLGNGYVQILSEMFRNQTPSFSHIRRYRQTLIKRCTVNR